MPATVYGVNPTGRFNESYVRGRDAPAPLRHRLTQIANSDISARNGVVGTAPRTFLRIFTVEARPRSVRILFPGSLFNVSTAIVSCGAVGVADVTPFISASWMAGNQTHATTPGVVSKVTFDHGGAFGTMQTDAVNYSGSTSGFTVAANAGNSANNPGPYTIVASDVVPFTAVPRTDGLPGWLVAVMVTMNGSTFTDGGTPNLDHFTTDTVANRNRFSISGSAWIQGTDYSQDFTAGGGGWGHFLLSPVLGIQYDTEYPGLQVMLTGDSGTSDAPTTDGYSQPLRRAAWDTSTPTLPIEVANFGWGGQTQSTYTPIAMNNVGLVRPSVFGYQALSRNNGFVNNSLGFLLADGTALGHSFYASYGTRLFWNSPICEPTYDPVNGGNSTMTAAFLEQINALRAASASTGMIHIDGPSVLGQPNSPWLYIPGVSDDNIHFNSVGAELQVPMCRIALGQMLGS